MNRALISAISSIGLLVGSAAAVAQQGQVAAAARFEPVRGAIRIDSTNVPFEVKLAPAEATGSSSIEVGADRWQAHGYDLKSLIAEIFAIDARLVDVPDDLAATTRKYDVSLSVPVEVDQDSMQRILIKALTQRFGVTIKPEVRTVDVYVLSAPEGPASGLKRHTFATHSGLKKLVAGGDESDEQGRRITYMGKDCSGVSSGGITVEGGTIADFRRTLEPDLDRVLLDETKLRGSYDFKIGLYANQAQLFELMRVGLGLVVTPEQRNVTVLAVRPAETQPSGQLQAKL